MRLRYIYVTSITNDGVVCGPDAPGVSSPRVSLLADDPESMAVTMLEVLSHHSPRMSIDARQIAEWDYSVQTLIPLVAADPEQPAAFAMQSRARGVGVGGPVRSSR